MGGSCGLERLSVPGLSSVPRPGAQGRKNPKGGTMFQVRKVSSLLALILAATLSSSIAGLAGETAPDDKTALSGLKEGKAIFDIDLGDPKKLLTMLSVIGQTADSLAAQGVKPNFMLAFRGASSLYVSSD